MVVGVRASQDERERRRNARATLTALAFQYLERFRYRVVVVEQDAEPRLAGLAPLADHHVFAYNPGPYNRGWGFNVGAALAGPDAGAMCFLDADLLVPPDFLSRGLAALRNGTRALLPYQEVLYLDADATERAIAERLAAPAPSPNRPPGRPPLHRLPGRALWVDAALYHAIGGHDERFRGWGCEDREICRRLERAAGGVPRLDGCLLHLDHPRPEESGEAARANAQLWARLRRCQAREVSAGPIGTWAAMPPSGSIHGKLPPEHGGARETCSRAFTKRRRDEERVPPADNAGPAAADRRPRRRRSPDRRGHPPLADGRRPGGRTASRGSRTKGPRGSFPTSTGRRGSSRWSWTWSTSRTASPARPRRRSLPRPISWSATDSMAARAWA